MTKFPFLFAARFVAVGFRAGTRAVALILFLAVALPVASADAAPALWKATRGQSTVYIFGTIHLLNPEVKWLTPEMRAHFDEADTLVLEVAGANNADMAMMQLVATHGTYPPGQTLQGALGEDTYAALIREAGGIGFPEAGLQQMKPWLAGITLTAMSAASKGFLPQYGVDATLESLASATGKRVQGLETAEFQIRLFGDMPEDEQVKFLELTLDQIGDLEALFVRMRDSWLAGDVEDLAEVLNEGFDEVPDMTARLLTNRNRNWVEQVDGLLDQPGTVFMAVGAGHLAGDDNLIELLKEAGIQISRQ